MARNAASGGGDEQTENELGNDEFANLVRQYRDALLSEIGVVDVEDSPFNPDLGRAINQHYPVEQAASTVGLNNLSNARRVFDISEQDDGETVSENADAQYATVRDISNVLAEKTADDVTLYWEMLPTPRQIKVAEYLESLDSSDFQPEYPISPTGPISGRLIETLFPYRTDSSPELPFPSRADSDTELPFPWLNVTETAIYNVDAIRHHVAGSIVTINRNTNGAVSDQITPIRFEEDDEHDPDSPSSRWATNLGIHANLAVERYSPKQGHRYNRVFIQQFRDFTDKQGEWITVDSLTSEGWGYVEGEVERKTLGGNTDDDRIIELETKVVCVPECPHPSKVLDADELGINLDHATPETPLAGPRK